jgi:hypothetical protein
VRDGAAATLPPIVAVTALAVKAAVAIAATAIALRVICVLPGAKSYIRRQTLAAAGLTPLFVG